MVYSEKLLNIIALMKCEDYHELKGYRESMVLIICTKNESNLTSRYWDMFPDGKK